MSQLEEEFLKALEDKYTAAELAELLELETVDIIDAFLDRILDRYSELWEDLKYGSRT